ncbi:MAG: hypothetical protein SFU91_14575 [Chloroherpetonaceae bacterium]|nr:hypothetical protein [Chloroherpetonaceae bacterium]
MRLASCGVTVVNSSAVFQINFSAGLTVWCSEIPHERQAQKRSAKLRFAPFSWMGSGSTAAARFASLNSGFA